MASTLIAVSVSEAVARLIYDMPESINVPQKSFSSLGPLPIPNQRGRITVARYSVDFTYSNNARGFRGAIDYDAKAKLRIVLLGDSFTYGLGVNDDQVFARLLQDLLPNYEVINAGNPNTGTDYALRFYEDVGQALQPDIVILSFCSNDFGDNQRHWYFDDFGSPIPLPESVTCNQCRSNPWRSWVVDHFRLAFIARQVLKRYLFDPKIDPMVTERYLGKLQQRVESSGARFLLIYIPSMNHEANKSLDRLRRVGEDLRIKVYVYPTTEGDYLPEGHWNASGHARAAEYCRSLLSPNS